jgi:hypothetical protein
MGNHLEVYHEIHGSRTIQRDKVAGDRRTRDGCLYDEKRSD